MREPITGIADWTWVMEEDLSCRFLEPQSDQPAFF